MENWLDVLSDPQLRAVRGLPNLPPPETQRRFCGKDGRSAFAGALVFYEACLEGARGLGWNMDLRTANLLDFGCGWGRVTQTALRDFAPENIVAVDAQDIAIQICRDTGVKASRFVKVEGDGGVMDVPDNSIDIAISYSVFSHLSEEAHLHWMRELHRVLRPGGVLAATTRDRSMFAWIEQLRKSGDNSGGLSELFGDLDAARARYDAGEYLFDGARESGQLARTYGEAFVPRAYVEREWPKVFSTAKFLTPPLLDQALIVARK